MKESDNSSLALWFLLISAAVFLILGWRLFWFLTDDAYIAFRYVSNSLFGYGYVWNPPPFYPVEGYTSFLWVVILDLVWRTFGVAPPESANYIALVFTYLTMVTAVVMAVRLDWNPQLRRFRIWFAGLLAAFLLANRTFLAWSSSGLETALFTFLVIAWFYCCNSLRRSPFLRPVLVALSAALLSLTRPDGILYVCVSIAILVFEVVRSRDDPNRPRLVTLTPFLLTIGHLLWRHSFYGEWLPNTYYAKSTGMWPASGWRYALSFGLEYALWFWLPIVVWAVWKSYTSRSSERTFQATQPTAGRSAFTRRGVLLVTSATVIFNAGYYTIAVGGDHFEYRIYNQLLPLIFLAFLWAVNTLRIRLRMALGLTAALVVLSLPVPWTHWALTHNLSQRSETLAMQVPIAPHWPGPVRWYAQSFDNLQSWLIERFVCVRHQEHKVFWEDMVASNPSREQGSRVSGKGYPVLARYSTGVPGWVLPHVVMIDLFGLNDYVIARTPVLQGEKRLMAHERRPPLQYIASLRPNVQIDGNEITILPRQVELTAPEIRQIEAWWWREIKAEAH